MNPEDSFTDQFDGDPDLARFFLHQLALSVTRQVMASTPQESSACAQVSYALFLDCLDLGLDDAAYAIISCLRLDALLGCRLAA
jgi:hypothetical protein